MPKVTLRDVARAAGVHYSTASRALDPQKAWLVNPGTATRIQAMALQLGYQPDIVARGLRRGQSTTIGVVIADLGNTFLAPLVRGVANAIEQHGFIAVVAETQEDDDRLRRILNHLLSRRVDAIVTTAAHFSGRDMLCEVARQGVPMVLAVRNLPGSGLPVVVPDDLLGGTLAARHLLDLGHRVVAQLPGPQDIQSFLDRGRGFRRVMDAAEVTVLEVSDTATRPTIAEGRRLMERLLAEAHPRPSGVFAHNDLMAIGAIDALAAAGLRCPRDVSVIGHNDSALSDHVCPPLSTVRVPSEELGRLAGELALSLLDQPQGGGERSILLTPTLVARASTAPPPAGD